VLADEWLAAAAKEAAESERDDDGVIELARDRDEVGHEVKRKYEIPGKCDQESFLSPWDARVAQQAAAEDHAVGDEPGERSGAFAPAGDDQHHDEHYIEEDKRGESHEKPAPQTHSARLTVRFQWPGFRPASSPLRWVDAASVATYSGFIRSE
jgi:hypothetical protein